MRQCGKILRNRTGYRSQQRMRVACWIPKAKNKILEYVIITAFQPQEWLHKRVLLLRYTYTTLRVLL